MSNNNSNTDSKKPRDSVALLVGGLFILSLVFASYNYFNKDKKNEDILANSVESEIEDNTKGSLNGDGAKDERNETESGTAETSNISEWVANDYKQGDISGNTYTVKSGDTLWEIAEAVYGNGAEWIKILNSNASSIGYLPNGQQALIRPAQVLVIP